MSLPPPVGCHGAVSWVSRCTRFLHVVMYIRNSWHYPVRRPELPLAGVRGASSRHRDVPQNLGLQDLETAEEKPPAPIQSDEVGICSPRGMACLCAYHDHLTIFRKPQRHIAAAAGAQPEVLGIADFGRTAPGFGLPPKQLSIPQVAK